MVRKFWQLAIEGASNGPALDRDSTMREDGEGMIIAEDDDVKTERERIMNTSLGRLLQTDSLILSGIQKYYGQFLAVSGLFVGIPQGECFGLLGVNGAGKTTTFKMITGDERVTSGDAFLDGYSIKSEIKDVSRPTL